MCLCYDIEVQFYSNVGQKTITAYNHYILHVYLCVKVQSSKVFL